ncbi:MAG: endonuclease/exonuclease/phosphatase family protein [Patescibacteria group bacterium]
MENRRTIFLNVPYGEYDPVPVGKDFSQHPKNMQCCEIYVGGTKLNVCNMHGLWELSGGDTPERLKMSEIIVQEVGNKRKVILAGDFNLRPNIQTVQNIEKHLANVFKDQLRTTFNLKRKDLKKFPGYASTVVDMIFTSKDVSILSRGSPNVDVSDHMPLVVEFSV